MTDELKREFAKLEEIETRYHQVMDVYREHIHQDEIRKWEADENAYQKISAEWQAQMDKIRRIADGKDVAEEKEAAEEQRIDDLKEQVEDEFVPEEDREPEKDRVPKYELERVCMQYKNLVGLALEKGWYKKATPQQWNIFMLIAGCKHDVTLKDVAEHACNICEHSENVNFADVMEALLQNLEVRNIWVKIKKRT